MSIRRDSTLDIRKSVAKPTYNENDISQIFFAGKRLIITQFVKDIPLVRSIL